MTHDADTLIRELQAKVDALTIEVAALRSSPHPPAVVDTSDTASGDRRSNVGRPISRAGLLAGAAVGVTGILGAAIAGPLSATPALAASDRNFSATGGSGSAFSNDSGYGRGVDVTGSAYGVFALSQDGIGLFGNSVTNNGIYGSSDGGAAGIFGYGAGYGGVEGQSVSGNGVYGHSDATGVFGKSTGGSYGVMGFSSAGIGTFGESATGTGVVGTSTSGAGVTGESSSAQGVVGYGQGTAAGVQGNSAGGPGVQGLGSQYAGVEGKSTSGHGLMGVSTNADGVRASSAKGRGGVFSGGAAAINLQPAKRASHPKSGQTGDLYVDRNRRLWFCTKSGNPAAWKQVQLS